MAVLRVLLIAFFSSLSVLSVQPYRILAIFPFNSKSHNLMFNALVRGLANRGHQVDIITHYPLKNPPATYKVLLDLNGTLEDLVNNFTFDYAKEIGEDLMSITADLYGNKLCEFMKLDEFQQLVKNPPKDPPYDLLLTEVFASSCFMGFGHLLKVPIVAVSTTPDLPWINHISGNNDNLAAIQNGIINHFDRTNFFDRLKNIFTYYYNTYTYYRITSDVQTDYMRKYLHPSMPHVSEIEKSVALILVNTHPIIFGSRPVAPNLVEVGGLHIQEENSVKLSPQLKNWLDKSDKGFIYFTLGSMVLIETLPVDVIKNIYEAFRKIAPVRVLMKIVDEKKLPPGLPDNVLTLSWIPQQAVLLHPNLRAFITHGGLMSTQEALYFGVPMIGIPLFGDQPRNINAYEEKKIAIKIEFNNLGDESLSRAINEVLNNPKYSQNAKLYSKLFKDRPASALETSIFWTEYVIRNGPDPLRSPAHELSWWQLMYFDIYCFLLMVSMTILLFVYYLAKFAMKIFRPSEKVKKS